MIPAPDPAQKRLGKIGAVLGFIRAEWYKVMVAKWPSDGFEKEVKQDIGEK